MPAWDAFEISTAVAILRREAAPHGLPLLAGTSQWKSPHKCRLSDALLTSIAPERFEQTGAVEPESVAHLIGIGTDAWAARPLSLVARETGIEPVAQRIPQQVE